MGCLRCGLHVWGALLGVGRGRRARQMVWESVDGGSPGSRGHSRSPAQAWAPPPRPPTPASRPAVPGTKESGVGGALTGGGLAWLRLSKGCLRRPCPARRPQVELGMAEQPGSLEA